MKRILIVLISVVICIIAILFPTLKMLENTERTVKKWNMEYEQYLYKEISGVDLVTVINKAINNNKENNIEKDNKGRYIKNDTNSIQVDIYISDNKTTYTMEDIDKYGMNEFIKNFNVIFFKGKVESYHKKTGQIEKIVFEQIEE